MLAAPARPEEEALIAVDRLAALLEVAQRGYEAVVIDSAASFSETTLLALDHTDTLILVGAPDVPAVRSVRIALETLDLLELDLPDVRILMNRAGADVGLDSGDIEQILRREIAYTVPSDRAVPLSINRGRPVTSDDPGSPRGAIARRGQPLARRRGRTPLLSSGGTARRRPGPKRRADLPVVAERVDDAAEPPSVRLLHRGDHGRAGSGGAAHGGVGIVHDEQHPHAAAAERLGTEVQVLRRLVGHPERRVADAQLRDHGLVSVGAANAVDLRARRTPPR